MSEAEDTARLQRQIEDLTERVYAVEQAMQSGPTASPNRSNSSEAKPLSTIRPPVPTPISRTPTARRAVRSSERESLESRIGSQLFNRIGIVALFAGAAWFFKFAIDNRWITPWGRILIGLLAGVGVYAWSELFRRRNYPAFAHSLKAVGSGTLYATLWAAFSLYTLISAPVAFTFMVLVTAANAVLALRLDSEMLGFYATLGGLATPLLLSTGKDQEVFLFSYLLLLDLGIVALMLLKPWPRLLVAAYPATFLYGIAWFMRFYTDQFGITLVFAAGFFALFVIAPLLIAADTQTNSRSQVTQQVSHLVFPLLHGAVSFGLLDALLDQQTKINSHPMLALTMAASYLLVSRLKVPLSWSRSAPQQSFLLRQAHIALAVIFFTLIFPLQFHSGQPLIYGWLTEGLLILWLGRETKSRLLPPMGATALLLGAFALLIDLPAGQPLLFNPRFAAFLFAIAVFACSWWVTNAAQRRSADPAQHRVWQLLEVGCPITANLLALLAVAFEIHTYFTGSSAGVSARVTREQNIAQQFTYSAWFMLYGGCLLLAGFWRKSSFLRWQALVLLSFTIGKVFVSDISQLSQGYRVISFLGLGALLLAVSFAYQRDWLNLRKAEDGSDKG